MSPVIAVCSSSTRCFPRVSGDEPPGGEVLSVDEMFSPRERG